MIDKDILNAVRIGILTDGELSIALKHYKELEAHLKPHGEKYHLVWKDVYDTLLNLELYRKRRNEI
jgi:hypothetical protein